MTWAAHYIGQPWISGEADCWAFARKVWRERFGWVVPAVEVDALTPLAAMKEFRDNPEYAHWQAVALPRDGDAVLMGKSNRAAHVGVWADVDGGGVLHSVKGVGSVFTPPARLGGMGYRVLAYYRRLI
jgi:hypothetical protein